MTLRRGERWAVEELNSSDQAGAGEAVETVISSSQFVAIVEEGNAGARPVNVQNSKQLVKRIN